MARDERDGREAAAGGPRPGEEAGPYELAPCTKAIGDGPYCSLCGWLVARHAALVVQGCPGGPLPDLLKAYADGSMGTIRGTPLQQSVAVHVASCEICRAAVRSVHGV